MSTTDTDTNNDEVIHATMDQFMQIDPRIVEDINVDTQIFHALREINTHLGSDWHQYAHYKDSFDAITALGDFEPFKEALAAHTTLDTLSKVAILNKIDDIETDKTPNLNIPAHRETAVNALPDDVYNNAPEIEIPSLAGSFGDSGGAYTSDHKAELVNHIKLREGLKLDVYPDGETANGKQLYSVGYGHQILPGDKLNPDDVISEAKAYTFLERDVEKYLSSAMDRAADLGLSHHPDFINTLAGMAYQNGTAWHTEHKNTYGLMKEGQWDAAIAEAKDSLWAKQTPTRYDDFAKGLKNIAQTLNGQSETLYAENETPPSIEGATIEEILSL
jgi:GH24 family phage-related lysozyme (muramidase)